MRSKPYHRCVNQEVCVQCAEKKHKSAETRNNSAMARDAIHFERTPTRSPRCVCAMRRTNKTKRAETRTTVQCHEARKALKRTHARTNARTRSLQSQACSLAGLSPIALSMETLYATFKTQHNSVITQDAAGLIRTHARTHVHTPMRSPQSQAPPPGNPQE